MEKSEKIVHGFDSLINSTQTIVTYSKNEMDNFQQSAEQEIVSIQNHLDELKTAIAANELQRKELIGKGLLNKVTLLECTADGKGALLQGKKQAYHTAIENQIQLIRIREQELGLQQLYNELTARLAALHETEAKVETISLQMSALTNDFSEKYEVVEEIKALLQNQNFGFKILKAQEEERRRVAREIHDGPAQAMANVVFLAEVCEKLIGFDSARAKQELCELRDQVRGCLTETRKIIFDLRPMTLDDLGLIPTVKRIADMVKERTGIQVHVKISGLHTEHLDSHVELGIFRVIQESLHNIEKHSNAAEAQVFMEFQNEYIAVIIEDNGSGFEVMNHHQQSGSFGLLGMKERINLLDGELEIYSQKGKGTRISVIVPLCPLTDIQQLA